MRLQIICEEYVIENPTHCAELCARPSWVIWMGQSIAKRRSHQMKTDMAKRPYLQQPSWAALNTGIESATHTLHPINVPL